MRGGNEERLQRSRSPARFASVERMPASWSSWRIFGGTLLQTMATSVPPATELRLQIIFNSPDLQRLLKDEGARIVDGTATRTTAPSAAVTVPTATTGAK